jgi:hypothetical protein
MKILDIDEYKDGGTILIVTDEGDYCIDRRLGSKTKGSLFCGYPENDNSNIDQHQNEIKNIILNAINNYTIKENSFNWPLAISQLLK